MYSRYSYKYFCINLDKNPIVNFPNFSRALVSHKDGAVLHVGTSYHNGNRLFMIFTLKLPILVNFKESW